jgi:hypothetical protein
MIPVEIVPWFGGGSIKKSSGWVNSSMISLIHCKNLCKYTTVPLPSTTIKKKKWDTTEQ